jgi:hypothetical protein
MRAGRSRRTPIGYRFELGTPTAFAIVETCALAQPRTIADRPGLMDDRPQRRGGSN